MKATRIFIIFFFIMLLGIDMAIGKPSSQAEKLFQKATTEYYKENYTQALDIYTDALEKATHVGNDSIVTLCTGYIGNIYDAYGDNNTCLYYYMKGYKAAKRTKSLRLQASFLTNIITCYTRMGNVAEAKKYFSILNLLPRYQQSIENRYYLIYTKARILTAEHRYDEAVAEHQKALWFAKQNGMEPIFHLFQTSEIGNLYVRMGKASEAIAIGDSCMQMAKQQNSGELLVNAYKMLADAYAQLQQTEKSRHYRELYFDLNDSVYNIKKFYKARYKLSEYEEREHKQHVSRLNNRISLQTWTIILAIIIIGLVATFSYIIYKKNRHLVKTQLLLIAKNKDLAKRERQNQTLLKQYLEQVDLNRSNTEAKSSTDTSTDDNTTHIADDNSDCYSPTDNDNQLLSQINDVMNDMSIIASPEFSLQSLADMVGSNTSYVSRVINNSYNKNFKTLLNEIRIREACRKLSDKKQYAGYTMQVIYEEVGYRNASSFIRAFRKVYNMTPSEFQKLAEEE